MHQLGQFRAFRRYLFGKVFFGVLNGLCGKRVTPRFPFLVRGGIRPGRPDRRQCVLYRGRSREPNVRQVVFGFSVGS